MLTSQVTFVRGRLGLVLPKPPLRGAHRLGLVWASSAGWVMAAGLGEWLA